MLVQWQLALYTVHGETYKRICTYNYTDSADSMASQQKYVVKSMIFVFGYVANHILHRNHAYTNKMPGCSPASSLSLYMPLRHALFA